MVAEAVTRRHNCTRDPSPTGTIPERLRLLRLVRTAIPVWRVGSIEVSLTGHCSKNVGLLLRRPVLWFLCPRRGSIGCETKGQLICRKTPEMEPHLLNLTSKKTPASWLKTNLIVLQLRRSLPVNPATTTSQQLKVTPKTLDDREGRKQDVLALLVNEHISPAVCSLPFFIQRYLQSIVLTEQRLIT